MDVQLQNGFAGWIGLEDSLRLLDIPRKEDITKRLKSDHFEDRLYIMVLGTHLRAFR